MQIELERELERYERKLALERAQLDKERICKQHKRRVEKGVARRSREINQWRCYIRQ